MSTDIVNILTDPGDFLKFIADRSGGRVTQQDLINSIILANGGVLAGEVRLLPRDANQEVFTDDLIPLGVNSIFKVLAVLQDTASKIEVLFKFGNQTIAVEAIDGLAFAVGVGKEFNFPVSKTLKINFRLPTASTVRMLRVTEFRIGQ